MKKEITRYDVILSGGLTIQKLARFASDKCSHCVYDCKQFEERNCEEGISAWLRQKKTEERKI